MTLYQTVGIFISLRRTSGKATPLLLFFFVASLCPITASASRYLALQDFDGGGGEQQNAVVIPFARLHRPAPYCPRKAP